ncbi:hypothetical protein WH47_00694 [Habropoda laboriosa]|uniref:Uncharacterized protein n=1 Tax=Habropoda laboriosa TaxID=597456 RepID=A0A0L7QYJ4_9HYME|nr:hypothetical protein WH47_00694 [Habropoda laboriosa]
MIVQSVKHNFKPENEGNGEGLDDSVIQSTLDNELSMMEMEGKEDTTTESVQDSTTKTDDVDMSNIDMNKLLDIAKSEAEDGDKEESSTLNTISSTVSSLDRDLVGATRESLPSEYFQETTIYPIVETNQAAVQLSKGNQVPKANRDESSTVEVEDYTYVEYSPSTINVNNIGEKNTDTLVGMENTSTDPEISTDEQGYTYLGKISLENKNNTDEVQNLRNSELFYTGDGVKLPLEIRKLEDGSYALSISRKVCEHLLNKECPCCVPVNGNVVGTVKRNSDGRNANDRRRRIERRGGKRISKRESRRSISPNERGKCDSADDSLQIFSMPVETFARRYNLSLKLEKVQTPWNFDEARGKIDEDVRDRKVNNDQYRKEDATSYEDRVENERNFKTHRYQRNIDENVDKRVEIMKNVLIWLRDIILNRRSE